MAQTTGGALYSREESEARGAHYAELIDGLLTGAPQIGALMEAMRDTRFVDLLVRQIRCEHQDAVAYRQIVKVAGKFIRDIGA